MFLSQLHPVILNFKSLLRYNQGNAINYHWPQANLELYALLYVGRVVAMRTSLSYPTRLSKQLYLLRMGIILMTNREVIGSWLNSNYNWKWEGSVQVS